MGCCISSGFLVWPYDTTVLSSWQLWLLIKVISEQLKLFVPVSCEERAFSNFFKELLQLTSGVFFFQEAQTFQDRERRNRFCLLGKFDVN